MRNDGTVLQLLLCTEREANPFVRSYRNMNAFCAPVLALCSMGPRAECGAATHCLELCCCTSLLHCLAVGTATGTVFPHPAPEIYW